MNRLLALMAVHTYVFSRAHTKGVLSYNFTGEVYVAVTNMLKDEQAE